MERVLAAIAPQSQATELLETSLSFVQRLLALDLLRSQEQLAAHRRVRSLLLEDLLAERGSSRELLRRLQEQNIDLQLGWRLIYVGVESWVRADALVDDTGGVRGRERRARCHRRVPRLQFDQVPQPLQDKTVIVLAVLDSIPLDEVRSHPWRAAQPARGPDRLSPVAIGCSGPATGLVRVRAAVNQGAQALQHARTVAGEGARFFEELPRLVRLLNAQDPEAMNALYDRFVGPLARHDERHHTLLLPTLRALCANRLSAHRTAEALLIHRNTLHKRLRRIQSILDVDLDSMDDILEVYLALHVGELEARRS